MEIRAFLYTKAEGPVDAGYALVRKPRVPHGWTEWHLDNYQKDDDELDKDISRAVAPAYVAVDAHGALEAPLLGTWTTLHEHQRDLKTPKRKHEKPAHAVDGHDSTSPSNLYSSVARDESPVMKSKEVITIRGGNQGQRSLSEEPRVDELEQ